MALTTVRFEETDLAECAELLRGRLAYPDGLVAELPWIWESLLREEALTGVSVVSDVGGGSRLVAFAAAVFVTDAWEAESVRSREPYLTLRTLRAGGFAPVLRPAGIARAHAAGGLNVLNLHYCERADLSDGLGRAVRFRVMDAFLEAFRGYRVRSVIQEFWDEIPHEFIIHGWGSVKNEYETYFTERGEPHPPTGRRPCLVGLTREEALASPGDIMAPLFEHSPARFGFTRAERELLRQALDGHTDPELAARLGIAVPTVKSRWRSVYERVSRVAPELLPTDTGGKIDRTNRGREKRRRLLEHLRHHHEELRP